MFLSKRIYLAGKWEEHLTIKGYADQLRALGHSITCPWFELHVGPDVDLVQGSIDDYNGVKAADMVVFVFEKELPYSGAMSELGIALALEKTIIVIGSGGNRNIFVHHPAVHHVKDWQEFYDRIKGAV